MATHNTQTLLFSSLPFLISNRIIEVENKIGAGLIEEVVQVAQGELKLVDQMTDNKM